MSVTLHDKAGSDIRMAVLALKQDDELDLQQAAYHVQQALEKTIKFFLEVNGVHFRKTHNVALLCELLPENQSVLSESDLDFIYTRSDTIAKWENEVRYDTDYMATRRQVIPVLEFTAMVHERVRKWYENYSTSVEPERPGSMNTLNLR